MSPVVLVLAGPTSAGKTEAALAVAERWEGVVLSADAMQVFRGMDIGTGKATPAEQSRVRHFGLDLVAPDEAFDAADFVALADRVLADHPRVVVCGGTSLYIRALVRGLVPTPRVDPDLRRDLEAIEDLHGALAAVDPALASRLHPHDRVRLVRGLEVYRATGQRLSDLQARHQRQPDRVIAHGLWLDRDDLDARIDARVRRMVEDGLRDEVAGLLGRYPSGLAPFRAFGYRSFVAHHLGDLDLDEAVRRTQRDSRRFARKQRTWMRSLGFARARGVPAALALADRIWGA